jgi:hypothetical protein
MDAYVITKLKRKITERVYLGTGFIYEIVCNHRGDRDKRGTNGDRRVRRVSMRDVYTDLVVMRKCEISGS